MQFTSCVQDDSLIKSEEISSEKKMIMETLELHAKMLEKNPDVTVSFFKDKEGKIASLINPKKQESLKGASPSLICDGDTVADMADCIQDAADDGICVTIQTCAYCAYEAPCPR